MNIHEMQLHEFQKIVDSQRGFVISKDHNRWSLEKTVTEKGHETQFWNRTFSDEGEVFIQSGTDLRSQPVLIQVAQDSTDIIMDVERFDSTYGYSIAKLYFKRHDGKYVGKGGGVGLVIGQQMDDDNYYVEFWHKAEDRSPTRVHYLAPVYSFQMSQSQYIKMYHHFKFAGFPIGLKRCWDAPIPKISSKAYKETEEKVRKSMDDQKVAEAVVITGGSRKRYPFIYYQLRDEFVGRCYSTKGTVNNKEIEFTVGMVTEIECKKINGELRYIANFLTKIGTIFGVDTKFLEHRIKKFCGKKILRPTYRRVRSIKNIETFYEECKASRFLKVGTKIRVRYGDEERMATVHHNGFCPDKKEFLPQRDQSRCLQVHVRWDDNTLDHINVNDICEDSLPTETTEHILSKAKEDGDNYRTKTKAEAVGYRSVTNRCKYIDSHGKVIG